MDQVIICGGNPLPGCPESWDEAYKWADKVNEDRGDFGFPKWSWDCGFKLDFDGAVIVVSSRFYPPKTHYGPKWDGVLTIGLFNGTSVEKRFECNSLDELHSKVELYLKTFCVNLQKAVVFAAEKAEESQSLHTTEHTSGASLG